MTKHIADRPHETGAGRVRNYLQQERESGLHPAVASLHSRPQDGADAGGRRVKEFVRIERGELA